LYPDFNNPKETKDTIKKLAATTARLASGGTSDAPKKP
jgi:hypothetical protein